MYLISAPFPRKLVKVFYIIRLYDRNTDDIDAKLFQQCLCYTIFM